MVPAQLPKAAATVGHETSYNFNRSALLWTEPQASAAGEGDVRDLREGGGGIQSNGGLRTGFPLTTGQFHGG